MEPDTVLQYCLTDLKGTVQVNSWGEKGIFYNPDNSFKRGIYVLTVKEKDGDNDKSSHLYRDGIFRVNIGLRKNTFIKLFGELPKRPPKGGIVEMNCDFTETGKLLPHPVYAWMGWVCMLNPSEDKFEELKPLILESYEYAKEKFSKKKI